ncbi:YfbU family protein [Pseudoduganella sp. R-34]|uniref:YfbU family protein n=1 Tax=Pseudoduganella sp. R-34 TaxID=3404062 RepID=UPI003CE72088
MDLKLTDTERLILANQYEILSKLEEDAGYARVAAQLRGGHEWLYREAFQWLFPVMPDSDAQFVVTVLDLHRALLFSFNALVDKGALTSADIAFEGFDGNDGQESTLLRFTRALGEQGRWEELLDGRVGLNSSSRTVPGYQRMIAAWKNMDKPHGMSKEQIETILTAKRHPK